MLHRYSSPRSLLMTGPKGRHEATVSEVWNYERKVKIIFISTAFQICSHTSRVLACFLCSFSFNVDMQGTILLRDPAILFIKLCSKQPRKACNLLNVSVPGTANKEGTLVKAPIHFISQTHLKKADINIPLRMSLFHWILSVPYNKTVLKMRS